jgi:farnesyl-diphosphate farnesyltransferase
MAGAPKELLTDLLQGVSRSFYLTLRVLPGSIRPQIGLAYLLARLTDTVADTEIIPMDKRIEALTALRRWIADSHAPAAAFGEFEGAQASDAEKLLLQKRDEILAVLHSATDAEDRKRIVDLLEIIVSGQELDLRRFDGAGAGRIVALRTDAELEDYTYRVAGCVGEFWTKMCRAHVFPRARLDDAFLMSAAVQFGKGLQLVNILRDVPGDLRTGRCYLPEEALTPAGLAPRDLMEPGNEPRLRPLYDRYLDRAEAYLAAGWSYTNCLPWRHARVRFACAWPILIGIETIARLRSARVLSSSQPIKISRREVRGILLKSVLFHPCPPMWRRLFPRQ